ncbi:enterochelin esterase [Wenzhouxiangella sp. XN79A]|uniref:alpha/beta hydrolase n=1 Tax=Wenzhouxiangella sp. XN79A TaxID=2724193 RepID=UPI00144A5036|nr:alpha/beta hydrolase-fold protein [Wenzhouxiangella sp. XN79A]NKI35525.1 enterochelin esterase [Wenzhouxiangella sp. XN79A]
MTPPDAPHEVPLRPARPASVGRVDRFALDSACLAGNPLGDPSTRDVHVYLPPGYDDTDRAFPVLYSLAAYTSSGQAQVAWKNHGESLPERLDRLIAGGRLPPLLCVMPDSYTALGGNQFVDSPSIGDYARHIAEELVPSVDRRYRTVAEAAGRAAFGKSSGGFGALHLARTRPGLFGAVASHAGDAGFDRVYQRDFAAVCDELALYDGDVEAFVRAFWRARRPSGRSFHALMTLCLAASYSPEPDRPLGLALPFDLHTARLDDAIWARWLDFDPVRWNGEALEALGELRGLWIDAGRRDQYFIHYGTRQFHQRLDAAGIAHHHEEFDGTHSGLDWRFDHSLPWIAARLKQD